MRIVRFIIEALSTIFLTILVAYLLGGLGIFGALIAFLIFITALFFIYKYESRSTSHQTVPEQLVSERHFSEIKLIVGRISESVQRNSKCAFNDPKDREVISDHFPELTKSLKQWDIAIDSVHKTTEAVLNRFKSEAMSKGIVEPQFKVENILKLLSDATLRRALGGWLQYTFSFDWSRQPDVYVPDGLPVCLFLRPFTSALVQLSAGPEYILVPEAEAKQAIESLFWEAQSWPETLTWVQRDAESGWPDLKPVVLDALDTISKRDNFRKGNGCNRCR
jgi:hypothetical protein